MATGQGTCLELERELAVKEDTIREFHHYGQVSTEMPRVDTECASCPEIQGKVDDMISEMARSQGTCLELERELAVKEDTITELYHYRQVS